MSSYLPTCMQVQLVSLHAWRPRYLYRGACNVVLYNQTAKCCTIKVWVCSVCIKLQTTCRVSAAPDPKSRSHEALNHQTVYFPTSMCLWFCATCIFTHPHLFKRIDKLLCVACPCWTQESSMYAFSYMSSMSAICQFSFSFQLGQLFSSQLGHGPTGLHKQQE